MQNQNRESKFRQVSKNTYLNQSEVGNQSFDLFDDLRLRRGVEGLKLHVEDCLFLGLLLKKREDT